MDAVTQQIILDVFHLTFVALALGLLTFAAVRRGNPLLRWNAHGNVWTEPFLLLDLLVVGILIALFYFGIQSTASAGAVDAATAEDAGKKYPVVVTVILGSILNVMLVAGLLLFLAMRPYCNLAELFGLRRLGPLRIFLWAAGGLVLFLLVGYLLSMQFWQPFVESVLGKNPGRQQLVESFTDSPDVVMRLVIFVSAVFVAPLVEEVLYRGYLYGVLKRYSERFFAAIVTSLLFACAHGNVPALLPLFLLAMFLSLVYELTGCLWVPILIHAGFNAVQTVLMLVAPTPSA